MWGAGNCEEMQLNWTVHIEILWEGGDRVFDAGDCALRAAIIISGLATWELICRGTMNVMDVFSE
jgi:hypothetical protein